MTDETKSVWADIGDKAATAWSYVAAWPKTASYMAGVASVFIVKAFL